MNEQEAEKLILDALNQENQARHQAILDDPERLTRYQTYSWWSDDREDATELDWHDAEEISNVTVKGYLVELIEDFGGEGQGDQRYLVFRFTKDDQVEYWRKDGYYASHYGTDWDGDFYKVNPVERIVTFYE